MKRFILTLSIFLLHFSTLFAIPAVKPTVPDFSGQFVYYKDNSFTRESYIGVIYYDESTYGFRYFAPASGSEKDYVPSKEIQLFITMDASKDYVELTGENIATAITPNDTDIVNYIHDFLYEMSARRKKAGNINGITKIKQEYEQFGGSVEIEFDPLIPIFNLRRITNSKNKSVLELVTAGQLISSQDQTFSNFKGIADSKTDKSQKFKINKKAKKQEFIYTPDETLPSLAVQLDSQWTNSSDNIFALGKSALLSLNLGIITEKEQEDVLIRRLLLGSDNAYPDLEKLQIKNEKDGTTLIKQFFFYPESQTFSVDYKKIIRSENSLIGILTLTVYNSVYLENMKYFDTIVNSYKIKQKK